jgi:hypothetical protein
VRVKGVYDYQRAGTDEKGEFVVIDFISEESTYFEYDVTKQNTREPLEVIITEEEWKTPTEKDTATIETQNYLDVLNASAPTSPKLPITNTEMNKQTCLTDKEKLTQTIARYYCNALAAIKSAFRQ